MLYGRRENAEYETELTATQTSAFATGRYEFDIGHL